MSTPTKAIPPLVGVDTYQSSISFGRCWHLGLTLDVNTYQSEYHLGRCWHLGSTLDVNTYLKENAEWQPVIIWFKVVLNWSSPSHALFMNLTEKQARCSLHFSRPVWTCPVLGCDKSGLRKKRDIDQHERYHRGQAAKRQRLEEVMGPTDISLSNSGEV